MALLRAETKVTETHLEAWFFQNVFMLIKH
jgi:hypothetical protein